MQGQQGNGAGNNLLQGQYDNSWQLGQEERMDTAEHAWMQQVCLDLFIRFPYNQSDQNFHLPSFCRSSEFDGPIFLTEYLQ